MTNYSLLESSASIIYLLQILMSVEQLHTCMILALLLVMNHISR